MPKDPAGLSVFFYRLEAPCSALTSPNVENILFTSTVHLEILQKIVFFFT